MPVNVFESSVQYLIAIITKEFLTKNGDFRQIKWFEDIKMEPTGTTQARNKKFFPA